jgi:hypothetical protein
MAVYKVLGSCALALNLGLIETYPLGRYLQQISKELCFEMIDGSTISVYGFPPGLILQAYLALYLILNALQSECPSALDGDIRDSTFEHAIMVLENPLL